MGLPVLAPALRDELGLSLTQVGVVIAAPWIGPIATLLPWGLLADRVGERRVLAAGLAVAGALTVAAAYTPGYLGFVLLLAIAGAAGASVNSASGRAVMSWFPAEERGLALGIRQASTPLGGFVAAVALPPIESAGGLEASFLFLGTFILVSAAAGWAIIRDVPGESGAADAPAVVRDKRLWRLGSASGLYLVAQMAITGFLVLFLHDERGLSTHAAATVLAVVQATAVASRIAVGRWSDVVGARIRPLRYIGLGITATLALSAALADARLSMLVAALIGAGALATAWNGLAFAAAAELAGRARSGAAIGFQQTVLSATGGVVPPLFAVVVSATSWQIAFGLAAVAPLGGWWALGPLTERPRSPS
jgi:sugar phosphate permease